MTISYQWLNEYLPVKVEPERLSRILTSIGLEVESLEKYTDPGTGYEDLIYEIGLTPNRMDAMSHLGVARDVCAYLTHHDKKVLKLKTPFVNTFKPNTTDAVVTVSIENNKACQRYAGVSIRKLTVKESPEWLKNRLNAIGVKTINNIVDITNYILHETGQPLHAFDLDAIRDHKIIVKNLREGTPFVTLDGRERRLASTDLMICDSEEPMCIGGVFGGSKSGVKETTTSIFLESAWFSPGDIRKTSFYHSLRTDAATRFEKGVDISNTVNVLKRAALLIREVAGGEIASEIIDVYPDPKPRTEVALKFHYLKKLSGKNYHSDSIIKILVALGFELIKEGMDEIWVKVPYSKPDITIGADIVEEILRIDGLDNVEIPSAITITPSVASSSREEWKEKVSSYLTGQGLVEILTNSITNSAFYTKEILEVSVRMMNSLSTELDIMRPSMLETGMQALAYNLNRRSNDLLFFEFGKTYTTPGPGSYDEQEHLCLYATGNIGKDAWKSKSAKVDLYYLKGLTRRILELAGLLHLPYRTIQKEGLEQALELHDSRGNQLITIGSVAPLKLEQFGIRQEVFYADLNWKLLYQHASEKEIRFSELPKQLPVQRDLSIVVSNNLPYDAIEKTLSIVNLKKLRDVQLFDIFESDKLGKGKKSMALSFNFLDEEKTLTDFEVDEMMTIIMGSFEKELQAEIRKG
ncbi:MAG: phenylalanine--tRNA ligase subunit beta [Chitinophagaceae bacterium]|nr:phenylalanine--tRNA ligase subunit beta [Chitinophagaceae bacterium]